MNTATILMGIVVVQSLYLAVIAVIRMQRMEAELRPTLRDYFAAKAIEGSCSGDGGLPDGLYCEVVAKRAYQMADAMLEARK